MSLGANIEIAEKMYARWANDPTAVTADWGHFFQGFALGLEGNSPSTGVDASQLQLALKVQAAIDAYRQLGHIQAQTNPLRSTSPTPALSLSALGLDQVAMDTPVNVAGYAGMQKMKLGELLEHLKMTYCGAVGAQVEHIENADHKKFLRERMEKTKNRPALTPESQQRLLKKILETETFESFLHTRFVGQKRFSLEGGEAMIGGLEAVVGRAKTLGIDACVLGMAHRGRVSVMTELLGKPYKSIFPKFNPEYESDPAQGSGDVKYHLGYSATLEGVAMHLTPNPSHLELVNPVAEGRARALQRRLKDRQKRKAVLPILIHGDAAMIGQGIVFETLNMSRLAGYTTGGTLHIVINNQIGFTTEPKDSRSGRYCTDGVKMIDAPVWHVNGDDPEAVLGALQLALEYRQAFGQDAVVDILCYRKHGHNESDEPRFTQPSLYALVDKHPPVSQVYAQRLGALPEDLVRWKQDKIDRLENELQALQPKKGTLLPFLAPKNNPFHDSAQPGPQAPWSFAPVVTGVPAERLEGLTQALTRIPEDFQANAKIIRLMQQRRENWQTDKIDWGLAEQLSWGSLLLEGTPVRLSGQDSIRGTFSHRHAGWFDARDNRMHVALNHLSNTQADFSVYNSPLSEAAVMGFDFGYSLDYPEMLILWEGQFGDFANGAQSMIDQYLAACEEKWQIHSGLTLLLPHGYEGQGPEHSSARLERFLQLCAQENIQVAYPSTPAQYFHLLRRQMKRPFLKPLVVMTPKSLLRLESCISTREDFIHGEFREIIDSTADPKKINKVVACSGKIFYELEAYRQKRQIEDTAVLRVEQLYPFHAALWRESLKRYKNAKSFVWCQEEPKNMGAWSYIRDHLAEGAGKPFDYAGRPASASPATGALANHKKEQAKLVEEAFRI